MRTTPTSRWARPITIIGKPFWRRAILSYVRGIHGDKKLGMQQLGKAIDGGRYLQPFAKILLALAARREKTEPRGAEAAPRIEATNFRKAPFTAAEYAKSDGPADSCKDASLSRFARLSFRSPAPFE